MNFIRLFLIIFFSWSVLFSQVNEQFTDGDFTNNPVWTPSASTDFVVSSGQLQSNNTTASSSFYISTPSATATNCQWEFFVNLKFATSGSNYVDAYLTADNANLSSSALNGYFVRIGNTSDDISLYKNVNGTISLLIDGVNSSLASTSNNLIKIKIVRDASNQFTLQRDLTGTGNTYVSEGNITDGTFTSSGFFGFLVKQSTSTFFQKHFFDDVYVGPIILDTTPPSVSSISVVSSNQLDVTFSENLDAVSAQTISNYSVNNGIGSPQTASLDAVNNALVHLTFSTSFVNGIQHVITINNVKDVAGNACLNLTGTFTYLVFATPNFNNIILTEIMVDVNPIPAGLPAKQYIELYNTTQNYFNLNGLQLSDGVSTATVTTNYTFAPGTYVMICKSTDTTLFTSIPNKIGTASYPTFNTTGDPVFIYDNNGNVLDSIRYTQAWYRDVVKDDGGWSLELINPTLSSNCPVKDNWIASNSTTGGTPGLQNSVYSLSPDVTSPNFVSATVIDSVTLELCFSEAIDASQISNLANYSVNNGIGNPIAANANSACVTLTFSIPFTSQQNNTITFSTLSDCSGNLVTPGNASFSYVRMDQPSWRNIILTEIMVDVNPIPVGLPAKQYIELYNTTQNYFNLNGLQFSDGVSTATVTANYTFAPGAYVLICKSTDTALFTGVNNKIGTSSYPTFNTTGDPVFIYDNNGNVLDSIRYTQAWYRDVLKDDGGWSLELINPTLSSNCPTKDNWAASNFAAGGTPGLQNSVYSLAPDVTSPNFVSATAIDSVTLELCFSEAIDASQISNLANYSVNNGIGNPIAANANSTCVTLTFSIPFTSQQSNTITFSTLSDCSGNLVSPGNASFTFIQTSAPSFNDVIVNEIMIDVNPRPVGLPAFQYLELYNKSAKSFNLNNWQISDKSSSAIINSNYILLPGDFVVIVKQTAIDSFVFINNKIGTSSFPTYNTTGDGVYLQDNNGNFIDSLNYDDAWYANSIKDDGGWSLELINPLLNSACDESSNWMASNSTNGGTPGTQNSVYNTTPDSNGPSPLYVSVTDSLHISVCFNEGLLNSNAIQLSNYSINNGIGQPTNISANVTNSKCFDFTLATALQNQTNYTLSFSNLSDCSGNPLSSNSINFSYYLAKPYDVVINELFPDPEPQVALPQGEFIELYNKSNYAVSLKNWTITIGTNDITIPDAVILPDSFLVLIDNTALNSFINEGYGNIPLLVLDALSSTELNISDEDVILKDQFGNLISYVRYEDTWYKDNLKKEGGWSLEQIDPLTPCAGGANWMASIHPNGGTPGRSNSVLATRADNSLPQLVRVTIKNKDTITVVFNESMLLNSLLSPSSYSINNGIGQPIAVSPMPFAYQQVQLSLPVSLQKNSSYTLTVNGQLQDCAGNNIASQTSIAFGMPDTLLPGDLLINEVLFAPKTGCVDYLELYNNSSKILDLKALLIGEGLVNSTLISDTVEVTNEGYIIFPDEYVLISSNPNAVKSCYATKHPEWFFEMKKLPTMNTGEDVVVLCNRNGILIDKFEYSDAMHFALLNDFKGVSLERIDFNRPTLDKTNWNSASANVGFGTPGYQNSQFMQTKSDGDFSVVPEIFSPDNDGYNDVVTFNYELNESGLAGNISIYNANGQLIRYLVRNENLATKGSYSWNGLTDQNEKAPIGIYIIYFETFSRNGKVQKHKLSCVLAGKL
jgi:hypothetical protein